MSSTPSDTSVQICPDSHRCENNSVCVENPDAEGKYYCDCDEGALNGSAQAFAGLYCQHEATEYCTETGEFSHISFCTNEGTCVGNVKDATETHLGCNCQPGYTGPHCQFVEGSEPEGYPYQNGVLMNGNPAYSTNDASLVGGDDADMGIIGAAVGVALCLSLIIAVMAIIYRRRRLHNSTHVVEKTKTTDGNLQEAHGESLEHVRTETFETETPAGESYDQDDIKGTESGEMA